LTDKWSVSDSSGKRLLGAKPALPNAKRAGKGLAKDDLLGGHDWPLAGRWGQVGGGLGACPGDMSKPLTRPLCGRRRRVRRTRERPQATPEGERRWRPAQAGREGKCGKECFTK
jgi:hypothetical protein